MANDRKPPRVTNVELDTCINAVEKQFDYLEGDLALAVLAELKERRANAPSPEAIALAKAVLHDAGSERFPTPSQVSAITLAQAVINAGKVS